MGARTHWIILATLAALVIWATLPPHQVSLGATCQPATLRARLSRLFYGQSFWRAQLAAIDDERNHLLMRMAHPEEDEDSPALETKMMHLADRDRNADPAARQQQADQTRKRRQDRISALLACRIQVQQRLAPR